MPTILGIESSCDDTSVALCVNGKVINNEVSQQAIHESYGGVVPELASRAHHKNIVPLVDHVLKEAAVPMTAIDGVAYTRGPGLLGALLVGSSFAKAMAAALCKPIIPVNHMRAHVLAHFIDPPYPTFPFLCLTVSGGHTQIVLMEDFHKMHVIGKTIDDA
ncbi:MAG: tRNA (adenosine(37)-N6)-threonylcarbamoyltransferase complex transferase subunit TsaD, partial [Bacteroidota bacterium]